MENNDELEFAELASKFEKPLQTKNQLTKPDQPDCAPMTSSTKDESGMPSQYAIHGPGYRPATNTIPTLPAGCYNIESDQNGIVFAVPALPPSGLLLELPEMRSEHVLSLVDRFWNSEKDYKDGNEFVIGGASFKAGLMIYGPPGSGKTSVIKLVSKKLVEKGGTVFFASGHPSNVMDFLVDFARIEPNRKSIVILEDIDSLIQQFGESTYLEMLDSSKSIDNVLFIATTNYPHLLDPRIYNRPGRFSHVVKIGLPTALAREAYLKAILKNHRDVSKIVENTKDFTIDHLTALVNAVYREKKDLDQELKRLRTLFVAPKVDESKAMGLGNWD